MKATAPRISDQAAEFLPVVFRTLNNGCESILDSFPNLFKKTVLEIKEIFEPNELKLLIDIHNGHMVTPSFVGRGLLGQCEDAIGMDNMGEKWDINTSQFLKEVLDLTAYQSAVVEFWASGFWYAQNAAPDAEKNIEDYIG